MIFLANGGTLSELELRVLYVAAARKQYIFLATGKYFDNTFLRNFCPVTSAMVTTTSIPPSRELSNH